MYSLLIGLLLTIPVQDKRKPIQGTLKVGDVAPSCSLKLMGMKKQVDFAALRGKPVVLIFGSCT